MKPRPWNVLTYLPFSYYYLGPTAFVSYLLAGRALLGKFSFKGVIASLALVTYMGLTLITNGIEDGLYIIRFFWGFLLFYLIFRSGIRLQTDKLLFFLSVLTIVEAMLVNTVISATLLPNYPSIEGAIGHFAQAGQYQRPYSFGGSASVTSVVLVALLAVSKIGWKGKAVAVAAILACMSGSGFIALFIYLFVLAARTRPALLLLLIFTTAGIVYSEMVYRISPYYLGFLIEFKLNQISTHLPYDSFLMGIPRQESFYGIGGDFAFLSFIELNGLVGLFLLSLIIIFNLNRRNWLPIFILMAGTIHYGVVFFLPGQLMLGYLLAMRPEQVVANGSLR